MAPGRWKTAVWLDARLGKFPFIDIGSTRSAQDDRTDGECPLDEPL
jgi:hypothetical protein